MKTAKRLLFFLLFGGILALTPISHASADSGRYFIKTTNGFWKNALGVRHEFDNGFTADLSDFDVHFAQVFGIETESVGVLHILPALESAQLSDKIATPPASPKIGGVKILKKGVRHIPTEQISWGIKMIYDNPAISSTSGGFDVKVAVLDTGVNFAHPDLVSRMAQCKDFTNLRFPVLDNKCDDKNGHGTHVAGIVAADSGKDHLGIYGVAPAAKILGYKVCDANGSCYADDIAAGLRRAVDEGANIINMSFGTDKDIPTIHDAVNYAFSKGVLMVAAAGNDGPFTDSIDYPGAYSSVIAVSALDKAFVVTDWSSRGINSQTVQYVVENRDIEFAAPGKGIESTWNNGGYAILSGTSMASPFVAGLAAKYWQSTASSSADATRDLLHSLATDIAPIGDDNISGFGLPQVKFITP